MAATQTTESDGEGQIDTEKMYWCIKCGKRHRRGSSIGRWHEPLERPEIDKGLGNITSRKKPSKLQYAAAIALALSLDELGKSEVRFSEYEQRFCREGFSGDPEQAINNFHDEFSGVVKRRHSGDVWLALEASGRRHEMIKSRAREYQSRGMAFGVRK